VGKSTLFNALTKKGVPAENFPFCTIDPSVGVVAVPDERLDKLSKFSKSAKTVPTGIEFVDIAGLVKGASAGEGLGNKFLANIRETDAIAELVRIFEDENVNHVDGKVDPLSDIEIINLELILADQATVAKRVSNIAGDVRKGGKEAVAEGVLLERLLKHLESGKLANSLELTSDEEALALRGLHLLTAKPILYVLNKKSGVTNLDELKDDRWVNLLKFLEESKSNYVVVDAGVEQELSELEPEDKEEYRKELEATDDGINNLIKESYKMLGLITFLTTGEEETRAWTAKIGDTAPQAGTAIHNDFKDKFIRAEVINWQTLLDAGSLSGARDKGQLRTEGKDYIVQDGDVIEFKI